MDHFKVPASKKIPEDPSVQQQPPIQQPVSGYVEPAWASKPDGEEYSFEVLKCGQIIETFSMLENKSCWSFGRLPTCNDIVLAHPTISRFHAVMQYRGKIEEQSGEDKPGPGWYIYDLGSTHGTFINKQRIPVKTYVRMRVGYMLKMGGSTRNFILLGPDHDEEEVKAESITEMKEQKQKAVEEMLLKREQERQELEDKLRAKEEEGISWGMEEDAEDEPDLSVNPFAVTNNEELFLDDPKKTLRGFFEREGLDLEYKVEDLPQNTFVCRIELPLEDDNGRPIKAEFTYKGKKKECVLQCALEACRILDRHGVLRKANQEAAIRRKKADSGSENDDDFLDRTGDIEKRRKRKAQTQDSAALTYEELVKQEVEIKRNISDLEEKILAGKLKQKKKSAEDEDDLDDYMNKLDQTEVVDKVEIKKYRIEQMGLQKQLTKVQRLIEITKPLQLPGVGGNDQSSTSSNKGLIGKDKLPLFGKKLKLGVKNPEQTVKVPEIKNLPEKEDEGVEEFEEEETTPDKETVEVEAKPVQPRPQPTPPLATRVKEEIPVDVKPSETSEEQSEAQKRKRQRIRIRKQVRDNVDMEETVEETEEKFTDWLPPVNQSGDGTTSLNDKLGY